MKARCFCICLSAVVLAAASPKARALDDLLDSLGNALTVTAANDKFRAKLSGYLDLEGYYIEQPSPGLLFTDDRGLFNPRLTLFLDGQAGDHVYFFGQARVDRGFDPSDRRNAEVRLDEFALRFSPWRDGRLSVQVGRFGTIVGNWVHRHTSWDNPFITAPVPYENLTGMWDTSPPDSAASLLDWGNVPHPKLDPQGGYFGLESKLLRLPIIWGPSYATGAAMFGRLGKLEYAAEIKNASLSSRPESWDLNETNGFESPTLSARLGYRPSPTWNLGVSGSAGAYLVPEAQPYLPPGKDLGDYRQIVIGQDISFEWRHWQVWAEFYEARFEVPMIGDVDTFAYYVEAKYKFTPQLYGAMRWNQQVFGDIPDGHGGSVKWGSDLWRVDTAVGYRFSTHTQLKLQYSLERDEIDPSDYAHNFAAQFTVKF